MSNRFFDFVNQFISGSVAKSSEVNTQFAAVDTGFEIAQAEINTAIKFPEAESDTDQRITALPAARHGYFLGFDLTGNLRVGNSFLIDWDMAGKRLRNLPTALASDEPVTYGQMVTYAAGAVAGLPPITAQTGVLTTDGSTIIWDPLSAVPPVSGIDTGSYLAFAGGTVAWKTINPNLIIDPLGIQGASYWDTVLDNVDDQRGYYWRNNSPLSGETSFHIPNASGFIPMPAAVQVTASASVYTNGVTFGAMTLNVDFFDSGFNSLSGTYTSITVPAVRTMYSLTYTTPANTAYVKVSVGFDNVDADAVGIRIHDMKLERGDSVTIFNDAKTNAIVGAAKADNPLGYGFASPQVTLGDDTATTSTINLRSTTGVQVYDARIRSSGGTDGTAGKGALTLAAGSLSMTGPIGYASEYDAGNSGATKTIDFGVNGPKQKLTLTAACAVTLTAPPVVGNYQLKIIQDSTPRLITWTGFAAGDCVGNAIPILAQSSGGVTFISLYWDGTQWWVSGNAWDA